MKAKGLKRQDTALWAAKLQFLLIQRNEQLKDSFKLKILQIILLIDQSEMHLGEESGSMQALASPSKIIWFQFFDLASCTAHRIARVDYLHTIHKIFIISRRMSEFLRISKYERRDMSYMCTDEIQNKNLEWTKVCSRTC